MESKAGRRFMGNLVGGAALVESLQNAARNHKVRSAQIWAVGRLQSATLRQPSVDGEIAVHPVGPCAVTSLQGNLTWSDDGPVWKLYVQLAPDGETLAPLVGGELADAQVENLEYFLISQDDFTFVRDESTQEWTQIRTDAHSGTPENHGDRMDFLPGRLGSRHDEGEPEYELSPGDRLDHPKLGPCEILRLPDEDRASIRLASGRTVELHLGLVKLERLSVGAAGVQHFKVRMRRRS